jgi:hypothetical protein
MGTLTLTPLRVLVLKAGMLSGQDRTRIWDANRPTVDELMRLGWIDFTELRYANGEVTRTPTGLSRAGVQIARDL